MKDVFICTRTLALSCVKERLFASAEEAEQRAQALSSEYYEYHVNAAYNRDTKQFAGYLVNPDGLGGV